MATRRKVRPETQSKQATIEHNAEALGNRVVSVTQIDENNAYLLSVSVYNETTMVSFRKWFRSGGTWKPGKPGVNLSARLLGQMVETMGKNKTALDKAIASVAVHGA